MLPNNNDHNVYTALAVAAVLMIELFFIST